MWFFADNNNEGNQVVKAEIEESKPVKANREV
jgi:hypothetical protein